MLTKATLLITYTGRSVVYANKSHTPNPAREQVQLSFLREPVSEAPSGSPQGEF